MRISDWSSDVCSSDLNVRGLAGADARTGRGRQAPPAERTVRRRAFARAHQPGTQAGDTRRSGHTRQARSVRLQHVRSAAHPHAYGLGSLAVARTAATTPNPPITESHTSMNPDDYCQRKAAQSGSSFYYSFQIGRATV